MPGANEADDPLKAAQDLADELKAKSQEAYNENIDRVTNFWGGPWVKLFAESDHDLTKYVRGNVPWDLDPMFNIDSGWPRKLIWWFAFISLGIFAVNWLMKPEFLKYWEKTTNTNIYTEYKNSLALPIVTICPNGNGMRCDCVLWKKVVCKFRKDPEFSSFQDYFYRNVCNRVDIESPSPFDPDLDSLCADDWDQIGWDSDLCGVNGVEGEDLYYTILNRTEDGQPFVTAEELLLYGAVIYEDVEVTLNSPSLNEEKIQVNESWINYKYLAPQQRKVCMQITPLEGYNISTTQDNPGSENGFKIIIKDTLEKFISSTSYAGVDVFITVPPETGLNAVDLIALDNPIPISGGVPSTISYAVTRSTLLSGLGLNDISKACQEEGESHYICKEKKTLTFITDSCGLCVETLNASFFGREDSVEYDSYGCDHTCHDAIKADVTFEDCPILCATFANKFSIFTEKLSEYGLITNAETEGLTKEYLELNVGAASFEVTVKEENEAQTFGAMLGNVGGFTNLYFGPDAMSIALYLETILFGLLLSFRTWDDVEEDDEY